MPRFGGSFHPTTRSACGLYKAIFPMMTPTMKNRTTSASSRVLRPSSFPAVAGAGTGLWLWAVFLIRRPSSSWGASAQFRQPAPRGGAGGRPAGGLSPGSEPGWGPTSHFEAYEGTNLRPLKNFLPSILHVTASDLSASKSKQGTPWFPTVQKRHTEGASLDMPTFLAMSPSCSSSPTSTQPLPFLPPLNRCPSSVIAFRNDRHLSRQEREKHKKLHSGDLEAVQCREVSTEGI